MKRWKGDAQRTRDAATLLPVAAAALLLPPFILVFAAPLTVAGIPLIVVYVFAVWAAIILGAWLLSRGLARMPEVDDDPAPPAEAETVEPGAR
ncbi:hypothetical protein [Reyranella sp.]|uniref:hypothetical protein n=1 Tax=Reyranella sp. TaxID=1929291 RepID=UPI003BAD0087